MDAGRWIFTQLAGEAFIGLAGFKGGCTGRLSTFSHLLNPLQSGFRPSFQPILPTFIFFPFQLVELRPQPLPLRQIFKPLF
jgi:hypothetical protein